MNQPQHATTLHDTRSDVKPLVSIIIPAYRRPLELSQAVMSLSAQSRRPETELIIADDDPTADTQTLPSSLPPSQALVYRNRMNLGIWSNINSALTIARGEWVMILPDDDLMADDSLSRFQAMLDSMASAPVGCLSGAVRLRCAPGSQPLLGLSRSPIRVPVAAANEASQPVAVTDDMTFDDVPKLCSSYFRRQSLLSNGGLDSRCHGFADLAAFLKIAAERSLYVSRYPLGCFRVHAANLSHPSRLWSTYPLCAADVLLNEYAASSSRLHTAVRRNIFNLYKNALWKTPGEPGELDLRRRDLRAFLARHNISYGGVLTSTAALLAANRAYRTIRSSIRFATNLARRG